MLTRKESTDVGAFLQALIDHALEFELHALPGHTALLVVAADETEIRVDGDDLSCVLDAVPQVIALDRKRVPSPSEETRGYAASLRHFGWGDRLFIAIDMVGDVVLYGDERQPASFRQKAACARNGRAGGAVALWDVGGDRTEWIGD